MVETLKTELNSRQIFILHSGEHAAKPLVSDAAASSKQIGSKTASKRLALGRKILTCIVGSGCLVLRSSGGGAGN